MVKRRDYRGEADRRGVLVTRVGWKLREDLVALATREGLTVSEALARLVRRALREGELPPE